MKDTLTLTYPSGYSIDHFDWSFIPQDAPAAAARNAALATLARAGSANFRTAGPQADLSGQGLQPGYYLVSVTAMDASGNRSPAAQANVTLVLADLTQVRVRPNPFRAARGDMTVIFDQMPLGSAVKVFTISGRWIKTLDGSSGKAQWDLTTDGGDRAASGIYLYLIVDGQGNTTHGKLAVIR